MCFRRVTSMPFKDAALPYTPAPGTGRAASAALVRVSRALVGAMNPPLRHGYIADCHVAIQLAGGRGIDINFGKRAAEMLSSGRRNEVQTFLNRGLSLAQMSAIMLENRGDVPLDTDLKAAATFEAARGTDAQLPPAARRWYTRALEQVPDTHLDIAISMLENSTHNGCVPLAILKERKGVGKAIVGKLGFRHPKGGPVTDWEFGGDGIAWH